MRSFFDIIKEELRIISVEKAIALTILIGPLMYAFFVGSVYWNKDLKSIPLAVVDLDQTPTTRTFARYVNSSPKAEIVSYEESYADAYQKVKDLDVTGFIFFPKGFETNLKTGKAGDVMVYMNTTKFLPANDLLVAIQEVSLTMGAGIRFKYFEKTGVPADLAMQKALPLKAEVRSLFNPNISYGDFLLPGIFLLILQQTLFLGIGQSISVTREKKWLAKLIDLSGGSYMKGFFAKSTFYMLLYIAYAIIFFGVIFQTFHVPMNGNVILIGLLTILFLFSMMSMGVFIGSLFKTQKFLMIFVAFTSYPLFLLSGFSWPIEYMPKVLQWLALIVPANPYFRGIIRVTQMNGDWTQLSTMIIHLTLLTIFFFLLALIRMRYIYRKQELSIKEDA
ncbi:MAG: ABC transporter permease [Hyphomicrobiales bacterium]